MKKIFVMLSAISLLCLSLLGSACNPQTPAVTTSSQTMNTEKNITQTETDTAVFGAGCFWCVEAVFQRLEGVEKVISGYSGGSVPNPDYHAVCEGTTGHAEVCMVVFDPKKISYESLLSVFWQTHDPTTLNRQGNDIGTQYRSVIFYANEQQKALAQQYKESLNKENTFGKSVVTEISPLGAFYAAEDYHQNYYNDNASQPYCRFVISPKVEKLEKVFGSKLKKK